LPQSIGWRIQTFKESEMSLWHYIEAHHEDFGAALFILPCLLVPLLVAALVYCIALLLH
jgi:hypothetical protein